MKILIYGINFAPEHTGIGKYTGEMAEWLARHGHEVRVVTAPPYYPAWTISTGYSGNRWTVESWKGIRIWRCPLWVPHIPRGTKRLMHLASFAMSSLPVLVRQIFWRPDIVWVVEPALFCAPGALVVARLCGAKAWLHVQDFEVDAAFELGLLRGKATRTLVEGVERWLMRKFDVVSTISNRMLNLLLVKGVSVKRALLVPNWVDLSHITPSRQGDEPNPYRLKLNIATDTLVALYSGNMGVKQGLEILAEVARMYECAPSTSVTNKMCFVFCGDGAGRAELQRLCDGLNSVHFLPLQPFSGLNDLLAMADIHLLPQRADAADLVMPSKLTGMLASGRPVVATAQTGTELAMVVAGKGPQTQCGLVVPPEDAAKMFEALTALANDDGLRSQMGAAARNYAEQYLHTDMVLGRLAEHMHCT